jgi:transporter family protein
MASWFWYAVVAAVLYGAHQIFTRMAADHIGEGLGGFVVEATAAFSILLYLAFLWLISRWDQKSTGEGIFYSVLTGVCVGAGTIAFFLLFQKGGPLSSVPGFCFFTNHHRGSGSSALHLQSQDCFCCAGDASVMAVENERGLSL